MPRPFFKSSTDLARMLKRNHVSVWRAIQKLGLKPVSQTHAGWKFYDEAALDALRLHFKKRKPRANHFTRQTNSAR